jgi:hypothetical protein
VVQKVLIFVNFGPKSALFWLFLVIFGSFFFNFYQIFLAYFTQATQINLPSPIFTPKTNVTLKKNLKKS